MSDGMYQLALHADLPALEIFRLGQAVCTLTGKDVVGVAEHFNSLTTVGERNAYVDGVLAAMRFRGDLGVEDASEVSHATG